MGFELLEEGGKALLRRPHSSPPKIARIRSSCSSFLVFFMSLLESNVRRQPRRRGGPCDRLALGLLVRREVAEATYHAIVIVEAPDDACARHRQAIGVAARRQPSVGELPRPSAVLRHEDLLLVLGDDNLGPQDPVLLRTKKHGILRAEVVIAEDEEEVFVTQDGGRTWEFSHGRLATSGNANRLSVTSAGVIWRLDDDDRVVRRFGDFSPYQETESQPVARPPSASGLPADVRFEERHEKDQEGRTGGSDPGDLRR